jgi:amino acid permease
MVALKAPYFGYVMGAVGGLTDALQCFVLPPMIYLKIEGDKLNSMYQTYYILIIFWGLATILYTAYNAFYEL